MITEAAQSAGHGLVHDLHRAAADQLLELHQRQVGLDAGGVAVHHQADGVVADEAVRHVRDVVGYGQVERGLDAAVLVDVHLLEQESQGVAESAI
jgi:hypothetical protein